MATRYGIISNPGINEEITDYILIQFIKRDVEHIVVNGISSNPETLSTAIDYASTAAHAISKESKVIINPGPLDSLKEYFQAMEEFRKRKNIIYSTKNPYVKMNGNELILLPGMPSKQRIPIYENAFSTQHRLHKTMPTGYYSLVQDDFLVKEREHRIIGRALRNEALDYCMRITNMERATKQIRNPEKTLVVSVIPRKFDYEDYSVDLEDVAENPDDKKLLSIDSLLTKLSEEKGYLLDPAELEEEIYSQGYKISNINNGDEELKALMEHKKITKSVCSKPGVSEHYAHTDQNQIVNPDKFKDTLHFNTGTITFNTAGIITLNENQMAYEPILIMEKNRETYN